MTDITELAQSLKAAAEKATPGEWVYFPKNTSIEYDVGSDESQGSILYVDSGDFTQAQTDRNGEFIALANPANILALVEALEKEQRYTEELREWNAGLAQESCERQQRISELLQGKVGSALLERENHHVEVVGKLTKVITELESEVEKWRQEAEAWEQVAEKQLATAIELESRTVKLPDLRQIVSGDRYVWSDGVYNYSQDVKVALAAAGIKVEAE
ncbi:TPA: ead/Ea22-like family protein [Klebsiella pneumoniae]|uniref:ead/Ea22-like family protein n=1 Tax=Klebsiella pneumoniae TaxID=573 RepID=UPI0023583A91|nr:ead/Ea22-like family protein [Klebsiella pneumoniae]EIY2220101.1 ead/Ea22-like family protein [Klebsiella pneumoniae]EIY2305247.1 ead/Ea22-like family protein [Klebsiella pneumoniae]EKX1489965.1 ead/Ea22-like family protein [Klebsiella pneumoniae]MDC8516584.1 ead/Ea22-like family protein [Klebsiella pneumoniae]MDR4537998.1 ead/Ea22-like family protein [Klebsiella pneumoniae]